MWEVVFETEETAESQDVEAQGDAWLAMFDLGKGQMKDFVDEAVGMFFEELWGEVLEIVGFGGGEFAECSLVFGGGEGVDFFA